jgi:hypothetical protein
MPPLPIKTMAVSILAGSKGLIQLGLSISDLALLVDHGKKIGNFVRAAQNDGDLFDLLGEDPDAILKRGGLVETSEMEKHWPDLSMVRRGKKVRGRIQDKSHTEAETPEVKKKKKRAETPEMTGRFTWVMVAIVSALDDCLPSSEIRELLIRVFVTLLDGDDETENALRVHIKTNVESWRSFGCAREIALFIKKEMRKSLAKILPGSPQARAIAQLNEAEKLDMAKCLVWLLGGDKTTFSTMSPITFSIAEAWRMAKLDLCTDGNPANEGQACIIYNPGNPLLEGSGLHKIPAPRGLGSKTLQISWPRDNAKTMIDALGAGRPMENAMSRAWQYGAEAASDLRLVGKADGPYEDTKEVYYSLEEVPFHVGVNKKFPPHIGMLADQGFPVAMGTQKIYEAIEWILVGEPEDSPKWLQNHVARDHLLRVENTSVAHEKEFLSVFSKYQALVFGFYYRLLEQILSFDLVEPTAFFHGIWGAQSTTFLAMCTQLGSTLRNSERVSRAHILYILAAMYNGRRKVFNAKLSNPRLVGVLGPISVLALPLVRTTDVPEEIWKIAVVDLPIVDLICENTDGELMVSDGGGILFKPASESGEAATSVQSASPTKRWTVHPHMSIIFGNEKTSGVVMAARCEERLVGWFNPLAADILFLSSNYLKESYEEGEVVAFEMRDENWQSGELRQPDAERQGYQFGIIRSSKSPVLRYAAAGFYGEAGEEVVIARSADELYGAFGRIEAQGSGIIIA